MKKTVQVADLKKSSVLLFRVSFFASILIFIVLFHLFPHYSLHPYVPMINRAVKVEIDPEIIENVEELPPIEKPPLPVEAESEDEIERATIAKTANFETFNKMPIPHNVETPEFVAYDTPPRPKSVVKPDYPQIAKQAGIEGTVVLQLLIDTDGRVLKTKVLKSITPDIDEAAMKAAYATIFYPAKQRDKPVRVWVSLPVIFKLK